MFWTVKRWLKILSRDKILFTGESNIIEVENILMMDLFRIRMSFIARYVYTYEEFVFVTEATAAQQNESDRTKTQIIIIRIKKNKWISNNNIKIDN